MNNIYKVIWSKAKNCYVVASEIAKSHTKSASGQSVRRSALASLLALSLLCGGLGVASASLEVVDQSGTAGTVTIYTKDEVDHALTAKGAATDVAKNTADIATNKNNITKLENDKLSKDVASATYATKDALNDLTTTVNGKADKAAVATALDGKANKADTLAGYGITDAYTKGDVDDKLNAKADAANVFTKDQTYTRDQVNTKLADYAKSADVYTKTDADAKFATSGALTTAKTELDQKIDNEIANRITSDTALDQKIDNEIANRITSDTALDQKIDNEIANRITSDTALDQKIDKEIQDRENAIKDTNDRTGGIARNTEKTQTTIEGIVKVDNQGNVKDVKGLAAETITTSGNADLKGNVILGTNTANTVTVNGNADFNEAVNMDKGLTVTSGDTTLKGTKVDGALNVTGESSLKNTKVDGTLTTTGKATFQEAVEMDKGLTVTSGDTTLKGTKVDGKLTVTDEADLKNTKVEGTLGVTGETKLDDKLTVKGEAKFEKNVTVDKDLTVTGKLNVGEISMKNDELDINGDQHDSTTTITADGISNNAKVTDRNGVTTESKFTHDKEGSTTYAKKGDATDWKEATSNVTADGVENIAKDSKDNNNTFTQTSTDTKNTLTDEEGNTSTTRQDSKGIYGYAKDKDGNKSYTKQEGNRIAESVIGQDGKETKSEMTSTDITNTAKDGTITNDAKDIVNNATGDMTNNVGGNLSTTVGGNEIHEVKGTKTETVEGKVTENFKNGQETNVTGNQDIHVTGKQTNTVGGGQENIISGGQTNTITGGQINNITGDQTTNVSGTQTTTATDINRNASSSMVDKVDNAYGTNTETKEAGKTTTDVSIKGTGEKGQYIRGANESRDYLIKGTLKNSETKTVDATSTEITDGTNKASTIQKVTDLAGSVTNGTETGVSGIHANDDGSVSIDSAVAGGSSISTINQKKDSITSQVTDGTTITKTEQGTKDITNTATAGTITNDAKDIVNKAQDTITNTAGTSITNQVNDSKVTTDANGTTFENNTPAVSDGGATTTKINGNQITTGRVDANELGVSDKDGTNTADLSVKAGEGVKASASDGTTTGSLDVTADEVGSTVKDASGKGSTFKQRIDAIMMESKNVSIKAKETLTNEAKVITNKASEVINNEAVNINNTATGIITSKASEIKNQADKLISNKVGENTWENMENGKITTSIKDGAKQNLTQSDAAGTTQSTVDGGKSTVTIQNADGLTDAVTDGRNTSVQNQTASAIAADVKDGAGNENASVATATTSANTIKNGTKANTVISTADGTSFINSEAAAPVTGASGAGTAVNTTIKGNTITTGKVTMDYAEVMKDLGVGGNANIAGTTTTKTLNVTQNATVGGTLDVTGKATFHNDVDITGDVTARSYKVDGKTYIDANGINANDQKITNVADGSISEGSKDAVNGGQLYGVKRDLEHQVDKVGANAAAMANLRPMEFDPSSKWNIAAAIGNYGSETAAALGAFYRPNDDVMVNLSTAFGTGENMVGGGVSVRLGKGGNKLSREESNALKDQVNDLTARMDALLSVLNPNMSKDFPDVPENHWAYEAVSRLAGNDIVQGYPDGEFHGERTMTRYEMAEIIYNALSRGAEAERELVEEFKPELQAMAASEKATAERAEG